MKTSELTGVFLDWAVTKAEGLSHDFEGPTSIWGCHGWGTSWEMGGPIIQRECITTKIGYWNVDFETLEIEAWCARTGKDEVEDNDVWQYGPTPLIAAMRCYVASQLGDEVDIPEQLMEIA